MTLVKICGITNLEDALSAVAADADLLGFNFYPASPRYIEPAAARVIIDQLPGVISVGVFANEPLDEIENAVLTSGVSVIQLHGDEPAEYCATLRARGLSIIKVFSTGPDFSPEVISKYDVPVIMLDAATTKARGGTGTLSDWGVAQRTRKLFPTMFLAGGLSLDNVARAIEEVKPFGVDACSSLEQTPGRKDQRKVRDFVAAVRAASPPLQSEWQED